MISDELKAKLPQPCGFHVLIAIPTHEARSPGGIILNNTTVKREQNASMVGEVVAMGGSAYKDTTRFPDGPWCKVGDSILFKTYSGVRFEVQDQEFRLINDDMVDAIVPDPTLIERV